MTVMAVRVALVVTVRMTVGMQLAKLPVLGLGVARGDEQQACGHEAE
jgi:hypothetical protein